MLSSEPIDGPSPHARNPTTKPTGFYGIQRPSVSETSRPVQPHDKGLILHHPFYVISKLDVSNNKPNLSSGKSFFWTRRNMRIPGTAGTRPHPTVRSGIGNCTRDRVGTATTLKFRLFLLDHRCPRDHGVGSCPTKELVLGGDQNAFC